MIFSSIPFLFYFLPITVLLYFISPKKLKNAVILLASMVFYAWGEQKLTLLFAGSILLGWVFGLLIEKANKTKLRKVFLCFSVLVNLGLLVYFKYTDFFIMNFNKVFGLSIPLLRLTLPIGISFYTFQIMSYTIDVYRGDVPAQKNLVNFAAYVSSFPQLIAGPIVRYSDIAKQLENRTHSVDKITQGIKRFLIGLGKKVLIANTIGEICTLFRDSNDISILYYWMYAISFTLQIYFDFSGYSDMAIGLGKIFGFDFIENFNYPYISGSITEFWRRWHISLGSWFRDYVYIPLGGNRRGICRQLFNIFVVWMLTGFWHGAAWNFILWGLFYAILLTVEKLGFKKWLSKHKVVGHLYVILAVIFGFILFNANDLSQVASDISGMFAFGRLSFVSNESLYYLRSYAVLFILAIIGATPIPKKIVASISKSKAGSTIFSVIEPIALVAILLLVTSYLVDGSFNPFLYFRF
ncbi:MAG: MBOAT family protein [Clostridia bacterium]|nr:MBOAT family protein [Clostridia bacterium]